MAFTTLFMSAVRNYLPTPFTIAVLLTAVTYALALLFTTPDTPPNETPYPLQLLAYWEQGFWDLLQFSMQMVLMLVLGHVLALTPQADALIKQIVRHCQSTPQAAAIVTFVTVGVGLINWGLALIFGAILARKVGEHALRQRIPLNYPLIGAAGYVGMMSWHGGLSGSAPLKVAEAQHFLADRMGVIPLGDTLFSPMNLAVCAGLLVITPLAMAWLGGRTAATPLEPYLQQAHELPADAQAPNAGLAQTAAEKLDQSIWLARLFAGAFLLVAFYRVFIEPEQWSLDVLSLNFINFLLFGLGLMLYGNLKQYAAAVETAVGEASSIILQFPLYAGIAGMLQYSGLLEVFSDGLVALATPTTYPLWSYLSAALVNTLVPSGGGQWAVQGPIIVDGATQLGVPYAKCVMALAYGDQVTNMIQPFWALPLLAITRLRAQDVLPYTMFLMLVGFLIAATGLMLF